MLECTMCEAPGELNGAPGDYLGGAFPGWFHSGPRIRRASQRNGSGGSVCVVWVGALLALVCGRGEARRRCGALQMGQDRACARWLAAWAKGHGAREGCRFSGRYSGFGGREGWCGWAGLGLLPGEWNSPRPHGGRGGSRPRPARTGSTFQDPLTTKTSPKPPLTTPMPLHPTINQPNPVPGPL